MNDIIVIIMTKVPKMDIDINQRHLYIKDLLTFALSTKLLKL